MEAEKFEETENAMDCCHTDIYNQIDRLLAQKETVLVAIDGNCTAGKTTLARQLQRIYSCNVFHMDEFFLQPHQRTAERLAQPGGNVDYERFSQEVLLPLTRGEDVCYRPFHCGTMSLMEAVTVPRKRLTIVEGTYSCHPCFGDPYDLKIFLGISPEGQRQRILQRPEYLHRRFFEQWIPMEQQYFETFQIRENCHIQAGTEETWD